MYSTKLTHKALILGAFIACSQTNMALAGAPQPSDTSYSYTLNTHGEPIFNPHFSAGLSLRGPYGGSEITNTSFEVTYVTDGVTPASDLEMILSVDLEQGFTSFTFTGADLGFHASGPGTFTGSLSTDALNGITAGNILPYAFIEWEIHSVDGFIMGQSHFLDTSFTFDLIPVPSPGPVALFLCCGLGVSSRRARRGS